MASRHKGHGVISHLRVRQRVVALLGGEQHGKDIALIFLFDSSLLDQFVNEGVNPAFGFHAPAIARKG